MRPYPVALTRFCDGVIRGVALLVSGASLLGAQPRRPSDGGTTTSLGQPGSWQPSFGGALGRRAQASGIGAVTEARIGMYRELVNRALGVGGVHLEAYGGSLDTDYDGGVRARVVSPAARIGVGADYNVFDKALRPVFSLNAPIRRGGLLHDGTMLRLDWIPGPVRTLTVGVEIPAFRAIPLGATRPLKDRVPLPTRRPAPLPAREFSEDTRAALAVARDAAQAIQLLCVPWVDHKGGGGTQSDAAVRAQLVSLKQFIAGSGTPRDIESETRRFHDAIDRAFSLAIDPPRIVGETSTARGRAVADGARAILLDEVLLPYNRLLGQEKRSDATLGFGVLARGAFLRWVHVQSRVPREQVDDVLAVFYQLLDVIESNRNIARRQWGTSRFVWLPLQLAMRPEAHDSQEELDALVAKATGQTFSEGNSVSYLVNEQFQYELSRTIRAAQHYHVLWIHDFRGYDDRGNPDEMSFRHVLRSYFAAMTARVRAYDSTGVFPTYTIILDEWFYQANGARLWMTLLEDPLRHTIHLPDGFAAWEDSIGVAQDSLRAAINRSTLLNAQRQQYGDAWLRNLVKVHVNITNTSDPSFSSWHLASRYPVPDTWIRDHRKVVFYDLSEDDPYQGEAIFTGAGIGEHYANLSWEDRSLLLRGPAALPLKAAARALLVTQGIAPQKIPVEWQPRPLAPDYDDQVLRVSMREQRLLRAIQLHNQTGYDSKEINIAKAVLYTMMPPGSVIKIPDSLWNGTFWGSAMLGCSLRGVRVVVIAPAYANAPARAFGSMVRSRELLWRLLTASQVLAPEIARHGGLLKVGLYASTLPVTDIPGKVRSVKTTLEQHAWLRELFDFPEAVYPGLEALAQTFGAHRPAAAGPDFESRARSLLHLKANFFASREAWRVMAREDWVEVTREFVQLRIAQVQTRQQTIGTFTNTPTANSRLGDAAVQRWLNEMPRDARERVIFYTMLGSSNQNDRSVVSDGEDALIISNWPSIIPYLDLLSLVGQSQWLDDPKQLDALLPRQNIVKRRFAHWFKYLF